MRRFPPGVCPFGREFSVAGVTEHTSVEIVIATITLRQKPQSFGCVSGLLLLPRAVVRNSFELLHVDGGNVVALCKFGGLQCLSGVVENDVPFRPANITVREFYVPFAAGPFI